MDAIDQCKDGSEDDFKSLRDEAAQQVALLAAGPEQQADSDTAKKVIDLLNKAYKMKDPGRHRDELEEEARQITQSIDSFEAMRRWMLREMADMLSNPQFKKALALRTKAAVANAKKPSEE
jgi:predicted ATP-grasp superfamily ATP-dependent carboligase